MKTIFLALLISLVCINTATALTPPPSQIPEPSIWGLLAIGGAALAITKWLKK
ncbi:MAG TPA: PEP-CTERM sorting domain-containing protein [Aeromonadales bacterium]|nr:PEP-CTERM sorting domain-containing protein [Aeromonadales bacterium]